MLFQRMCNGPDETPTTNVAFNPIIMAPPTDYNTIYTTLKRLLEVSQNLGFQYLPVFFDMGPLTKAMELGPHHI